MSPEHLARQLATDLLSALRGRGCPLTVEVTEGDTVCVVQLRTKVARIPCEREQCRADILAAIRDAGAPLTRRQVVKRLKERRTPHGAGTVAKALAELTATGELTNRRDRKGYRLPGRVGRDLTPDLFE